LINSLTARLNILLAQARTQNPTITFAFTRDLQLRDTGNDVQMLQQFLNTKGFLVSQTGPGSPGNETTYFGVKTWQALVRFQKSVGIKPASGYFGPITQAWVNNLIP
jgi:peptidoglycan hydrolase-like protein with peptidoglycan-binding domain